MWSHYLRSIVLQYKSSLLTKKVLSGILKCNLYEWTITIINHYYFTYHSLTMVTYWRPDGSLILACLLDILSFTHLTLRQPRRPDGGGRRRGDSSEQGHGLEGPRVRGLYLCLEPSQRPAGIGVSHLPFPTILLSHRPHSVNKTSKQYCHASSALISSKLSQTEIG